MGCRNLLTSCNAETVPSPAQPQHVMQLLQGLTNTQLSHPCAPSTGSTAPGAAPAQGVSFAGSWTPPGTAQHTRPQQLLAAVCLLTLSCMQVPVKDVATKPIEGQKTGTSGLRKKTKVLM